MNKPNRGLKSLQTGATKSSTSIQNLQPKVTVDNLKKQIGLFKCQLERRNIKVSKAADS